MKTNAIEIEGLCKRYPKFALRDVSFTVPKGYLMGLIGPNGSGKTTLIKLLMNLTPRDAGRVHLFGLDNVRDEVAVKARLGFVYDEPCFPGDSSLRDIARAVAPFYRRWDHPAFRRFMAAFELPEKRRFKKLSHGMKMKFALALALSHHADLLIMDESTAGLDPVFRRQLLGTLAEILQDAEKTILFSTHITSDLERTADYLTFIQDGKVLFSSSLDDFREQWGLIKGGEELLDRRVRGLWRGLQRTEFGVEALTDNLPEARRLLGPAGVLEPPSLEDLMYFLTRRQDASTAHPEAALAE